MAQHPTRSFSDKLGGAPHSKQSLRLWLRLLSCTIVIEKRVRLGLDERFGTTLPRFDALAALDRHPAGLTLSQLSASLMVSNGNVTGVVRRLIGDGLVSRRIDQTDRRSASVCLTRKGRQTFRRMAAVHERWIDGMFGKLSAAEVAALMKRLAKLRASIEAYPG